jgi:hypothetical protein
MTLIQKQGWNIHLRLFIRVNKYHFFQHKSFFKKLIFIGFKCLNIKHLPSKKDIYFYASYAEAY